MYNLLVMRILRIDLDSPVPAYEQILSGLRAMLVAGELKPGEQLSTVRELAVDLGVHHNTVAEAYRILAVEGWLDLRRGRGATVLGRPAPKSTPEAKTRFVRQLQELAAKAIAEGVPRSDVAKEMSSLSTRIRDGGVK
jgi:GntR family transcriptional regulator